MTILYALTLVEVRPLERARSATHLGIRGRSASPAHPHTRAPAPAPPAPAHPAAPLHQHQRTGTSAAQRVYTHPRKQAANATGAGPALDSVGFSVLPGRPRAVGPSH